MGAHELSVTHAKNNKKQNRSALKTETQFKSGEDMSGVPYWT
jgi:hypothetical protein